jgi:hypothetical protein
MPEPESVTLEFLGRQMERPIGDVAALKDDMNVLTAIVLRLDGTLQGLAQETRAVHGQMQRMNQRVSRLEGMAAP